MIKKFLLSALLCNVVMSPSVFSVPEEFVVPESIKEFCQQALALDLTQSIGNEYWELNGSLQAIGRPVAQDFFEVISDDSAELKTDKNGVWTVQLAFSPDGKTIAAGQADGRIFIWNVVTGELVQILHGGVSCVTSLVFSKDGKFLAVTGKSEAQNKALNDEKTVQIWDLEDNICIDEMSLGLNKILGIYYYRITKFEVLQKNGNFKFNFEKSIEPNNSACSPNKKLFTSWHPWLPSLYVTMLFRQSPNAPQQNIDLKGHNASVACGTFSPNGMIFASGAGDGSTRLWPIFYYEFSDLSFLECVVLHSVFIKGCDPISLHEEWKAIYDGWKNRCEFDQENENEFVPAAP